MKIADKIYDDFLGVGYITEIVDKMFVMVKFDKTPSIHYNMGKNPTLMFIKNLKLD